MKRTTIFDAGGLAVQAHAWTTINADGDERDGVTLLLTDFDGETISLLDGPDEIRELAARIVAAVADPPDAPWWPGA